MSLLVLTTELKPSKDKFSVSKSIVIILPFKILVNILFRFYFQSASSLMKGFSVRENPQKTEGSEMVSLW